MSELTLTARVMIGRSLRLSRRNIDAMMTGLILPIMLMLMFVYLFGGAIHTGIAYVDYVVPGLLVLCAGFGSAVTAVSVCADMTSGMVDRLRSMNVSGAALLTGHVFASMLRNLVSAALTIGVALLIGFRPAAGPVDWLAAAGVLLLFIAAVSWLSAVVGLLTRSAEAANGATFLLLFLPYASSAFVPVDTMPTWLRGFAGHQPATPVIETLRGLLTGGPVGHPAVLAATWCGGCVLMSVLLAGVVFQRRLR